MNGDVFLLKGGDGGGTEVFTTIDALRATGVSINGSPVGLTSKDSGGWRELLSGGGIRSMTITADGVWTAATEQTTLRARAMDGVARNYQLDDSDAVIEGSFVVASFQIDGNNGEEQTYSVTLESADEPTVT